MVKVVTQEEQALTFSRVGTDESRGVDAERVQIVIRRRKMVAYGREGLSDLLRCGNNLPIDGGEVRAEGAQLEERLKRVAEELTLFRAVMFVVGGLDDDFHALLHTSTEVDRILLVVLHVKHEDVTLSYERDPIRLVGAVCDGCTEVLDQLEYLRLLHFGLAVRSHDDDPLGVIGREISVEKVEPLCDVAVLNHGVVQDILQVDQEKIDATRTQEKVDKLLLDVWIQLLHDEMLLSEVFV